MDRSDSEVKNLAPQNVLDFFQRHRVRILISGLFAPTLSALFASSERRESCPSKTRERSPEGLKIAWIAAGESGMHGFGSLASGPHGA